MLLLAALLIHLPFLTGHVTFQLTDGMFHYRAVTQIAQAHSEGIVYPRWLPEQLLGLGDASFMHYPPLFHWLAAVGAAIMGSSWAGMRLVLLLSTVMAGILAYRFLQSYAPGAALLGALLVEANPLPIHLMFKAEAYPWAAAYPLVLLFFMLLADLPRRLLVPRLALVVGTTALLHILTCFMLLVTALLGIVLSGIVMRQSWRATLRQIAQIGVSGTVGVALAGIYVVPAVTTLRHVTPAAWQFTGVCSPNQAFVFPLFTYQQGICWSSYQILLPAMVLVLWLSTAWIVIRKVAGRKEIVYLSSALVALLFASEISFPVWQFRSPLSFVQFPSRFDFIAFAAVLLAFSIVAVQTWNSAARMHRVAMVAAAGLPLVCLAALEFDVIRNGHAIILSGRLANDTDIGTLGEYRPSAIRPAYKKYVVAGGFAAECRARNAKCRTELRTSKRQLFEIESPVSQTIRLPLAFYPAWAVYINGRAVSLQMDNGTGLLQVPVAEGRNEVDVRWASLPEERAGMGISGAAILALCIEFRRKRIELADAPSI